LPVVGLLFAGFCFAKAMPESRPPAASLRHRAGPEATSGLQTKNIEQIRVGERVVADNPDVDSPAETQVDPKTWRKLVLRAEERWEDGTIDDINVETLQPLKWIDAVGARVGAMVPLPLDLVEMGLPGDLQAEVMSVDPCPHIRAGAGRVVLTTVNHLNNYVLELTIRSARGHETIICPTGFHKFYRPRDEAWVSAQELGVGDQLQGVKGPITVVSTIRVPGIHRVYNFTVEGEHAYNVSGLGVLVHNADCLPDDALVVRGGQNTTEAIRNGSGVTVDASGNVHGVSVQSAPGATVAELADRQVVPHNQIGVTTVGDVRGAGGNVVPDPRPGNPNHANLGGITPDKASELLTPTVPNPNPRPRR